jgi:hypothetical protein
MISKTTFDILVNFVTLANIKNYLTSRMGRDMISYILWENSRKLL